MQMLQVLHLGANFLVFMFSWEVSSFFFLLPDLQTMALIVLNSIFNCFLYKICASQASYFEIYLAFPIVMNKKAIFTCV